MTAVSRPPLTLGGLPGAVRTRVVALAADVLPDVVRLPPALRRVAGFAPQRRARLGGSAIAAALETDDEFRERVGTQVAARTSYDADALPGLVGGDEGVDPAEVAAAAWLVRPEGWEDVLHAVAERLQERPDAAEREAAEVARLRDKLADAEQAVRDLRTRNRAQVDEYKTENASLRRKLGESRAAERAARAAARGAAAGGRGAAGRGRDPGREPGQGAAPAARPARPARGGGVGGPARGPVGPGRGVAARAAAARHRDRRRVRTAAGAGAAERRGGAGRPGRGRPGPSRRGEGRGDGRGVEQPARSWSGCSACPAPG